MTTDSDHDQPIAANLLQQPFTAERPNQRWVSDTTQLVLGESGKLYLAVILDLFFPLRRRVGRQCPREIGIRVAIGAAPSGGSTSDFGEGQRRGIGAAIGMLVAAGVTRYLESMLFELTPLDPPTFVAVAALFLAVGPIATCLPALRASRVDPLVALRHD